MSKKVLITSGTAHYQSLGEDMQRPILKNVVSEVTAYFRDRMGYIAEIPEIQEDPTANTLRQKLDRWFMQAGQEDDWILFYYTGHAELVGGKNLYLLTTDYENGYHASTAFSFQQLADMLSGRTASGNLRSVRQLLIILDTCYSGNTLSSMITELNQIFVQGGSTGMFYILAATFPNEEALAGKLAGALIKSIDELSRRNTSQPYLFFDQLIFETNQKLGAHVAYFGSLISPRMAPQFFPNPYYRAAAVSELPLYQHYLTVDEQEYQSYWYRTPNPAVDTIYFRSRQNVLNTIADWLRNKEPLTTMIITGPPGAGKSEILVMVVRIAQKELVTEGVNDNVISAMRRLSLAIHARGKTYEEMLKVIAKRLAVEAEPETIRHAINEQEFFFLVIDALDEAAEPEKIAALLVGELMPSPKLKLLLGTRSELLSFFKGKAAVIRIDDEHYLSQENFRSSLTGHFYAQQAFVEGPGKDILDKVDDIAKLAFPNFLIGRLMVENFAITDLEGSLYPPTLDAAFTTYLQRFGPKQEMVIDILRPLSWAEGSGLPWDQIWPAMASALSSHAYEHYDIEAVLISAKSFIIEISENGRIYYRLFHQALADYFRKAHNEVSEKISGAGRVLKESEKRNASSQHELIYQALLDVVPNLLGSKEKDWRLANPYILQHLATHASHAGMLSELATDPLFLLTADPMYLLNAMETAGGDIRLNLLDAYQSVVHFIREEADDTSAAYLRMSAWRFGMPELYDHPSWSVIPQKFITNWAMFEYRLAGNTFAKGEAPISDIVSGHWRERPVVSLVRNNGRVEIWDPKTYARLQFWDAETQLTRWHLTATRKREQIILVAGSENGDISCYIPDTNEILRTSVGHKLTGLTTIVRAGEEMLVVCKNYVDLIIYSLPELNEVLRSDTSVTTSIFAMRSFEIDGQENLLAVGDFYVPAQKTFGIPGSDVSIRCFSATDLSLLWQGEPNDRKFYNYIEIDEIGGKPMVVLSENGMAHAQIWDLSTHKMLVENYFNSRYAWLYRQKDQVSLLTFVDKRLNSVRLTYDGERNQLSTAECVEHQHVQVEGMHFAHVAAGQRPKLISLNTDHLLIWDVANFYNDPDLDLAQEVATRFAGQFILYKPCSPYLFIGNHRGLMALSTSNGLLIKDILFENLEKFKLASSNDDCTRMVLATETDIFLASVKGLDIKVIKHLGRFPHITRLDITRYGSNDIVMAAVSEGRICRVKLWTGSDGAEIQTFESLQLSMGQEDKPIYGLCALPVNGDLRIAFASKYSMVNINDLSKLGPGLSCDPENWHLYPRDNQYISAMSAFEYQQNKLLAVAQDSGRLTLMDLEFEHEYWTIQEPLQARINVIRHIPNDEHLYFVCGDESGRLKIWSDDTEPIAVIELQDPVQDVVVAASGSLFVKTTKGLLLVNINNYIA